MKRKHNRFLHDSKFLPVDSNMFLKRFFQFSRVSHQGVAGHMFRTEPVIAENRFTKITIGDNQKSL